MAKVKIHPTRNFLQCFTIEFEFPAYAESKPGVALIKITGMTGAPEWVDPVEYFQQMKELLKAGKAEMATKK